MAWTYNSIRIFVQEMSDTRTQIIPRLQPLASGTILQFFGYEDEVKSLSSIIVGSGDKASLEALMTTGNSYELVSPEGSLGDYYPESMVSNRIAVVSQSLRTDLACDSEMYNVEMKLFKDI